MTAKKNRSEIYLDHGATTPVHPDVVASMTPYWNEDFGNPSSHHRAGYRAARAVDTARELVADLLGASPDEIYFTGCGTESNNLALRGAMIAARATGRGHHLITSCVEHGAVLETARQLRDYFGFDLTILPVDHYGQVQPEQVEAALRPETVLVSIMAANNEIGTIQPWAEIGAIARSRGVLYHTDAVQLVAARRWDLTRDPIDMMTLAPHKFYGPKGIGILYVRNGVSLISTLTGGGHERGLRAGTLNVPLVVGAAEALRLAMSEQSERLDHFSRLRDVLLDDIPAALPDTCVVTGHPEQRLPHHASFAFKAVSGNDLLMHLDMAGIAASSGSACSSGDPKPSAILEALGLDAAWTKGGLRLTVGRQNTVTEIEQVARQIPSIVNRILALDNRLQPVPA